MSSQMLSSTPVLKSYAHTVQPPVYNIPAKPYYVAAAPNLLEDICRQTEDLELLDPAYRRELLQHIRSNASGTAVYGEFTAPPDVEAQKLIIGKGGYNFKLTTKNAGIYLIWHNRLRNIFGFWAPSKDSLFLAMNLIRSRLVKIVVYVLPEKRQAVLPVTVVNICQTPPPAPERTVPPPLLCENGRSFRTVLRSQSPSPEPITHFTREDGCRTRCSAYPSYEAAGAAASHAFCMTPPPPPQLTSPPAHRRPMQRSVSIIAPESEQFPCIRSSSMRYPDAGRSCSLIEDISEDDTEKENKVKVSLPPRRLFT